MNKLATLTGVAALAAGFVLAGPGTVMAQDDTICDDRGTPFGVAIADGFTVDGNVIVLPGATCTLGCGVVVEKGELISSERACAPTPKQSAPGFGGPRAAVVGEISVRMCYNIHTV